MQPTKNGPLMRVAITGASGLIGGALARHLEARGDEIVTLV
ncbi:MAG: nucleoside-diphosphate-sugar epimerase, partial [Glaciecola sp.]